jgi:voltage-gated potassium channel
VGRMIMKTDTRNAVKARLNTIIFGADTPLGRAYDIALLGVIGVSVSMVMLDSVESLNALYGRFFYAFEWGFTIFFTLEYGVRLWCGDKALRYAFSFFGIVDFLGVIPTYLGLLFPGSHYLVAIRFLRVLRVFRVMKLSSYEGELRAMSLALKASRRRILVFLFFVLTLVVVLGSLMYVVEGESNGFTSIPTSIYWAIVTLTTVGYGDISPRTPVGQAVAALLMIMGYSIIVVPTGIVSVEAARTGNAESQTCAACRRSGHDADATHCKFCGALLRLQG